MISNKLLTASIIPVFLAACGGGSQSGTAITAQPDFNSAVGEVDSNQDEEALQQVQEEQEITEEEAQRAADALAALAELTDEERETLTLRLLNKSLVDVNTGEPVELRLLNGDKIIVEMVAQASNKEQWSNNLTLLDGPADHGAYFLYSLKAEDGTKRYLMSDDYRQFAYLDELLEKTGVDDRSQPITGFDETSLGLEVGAKFGVSGSTSVKTSGTSGRNGVDGLSINEFDLTYIISDVNLTSGMQIGVHGISDVNSNDGTYLLAYDVDGATGVPKIMSSGEVQYTGAAHIFGSGIAQKHGEVTLSISTDTLIGAMEINNIKDSGGSVAGKIEADFFADKETSLIRGYANIDIANVKTKQGVLIGGVGPEGMNVGGVIAADDASLSAVFAAGR